MCHEGKAVDLLHIEIAHTDMPGESSWTKIQSYLHILCLTMHAAKAFACTKQWPNSANVMQQ